MPDYRGHALRQTFYSGMICIEAGTFLAPLIPSPVDVRVAVRVDDIMNEAQWFYSTPVGYNNYKVKAISFEGINLGVRPDLQ